MANRRMIASDIWRDEFVGGLDLMGRVLWVGLITTCADDQGRLMNNPKLIRSDVFPLDDIPISDISSRLGVFLQSEKIAVYEADGKSLIQIINWWEYQTPSWASASKFPAPPGWTDREKYHITGNKVASRNWDMKGGYASVGTHVGTYVGRVLNEGEGDVKGEGEGEGEEPGPNQALKENPDIALYREITGQTPTISDLDRISTDITEIRKRKHYPPIATLKAYLLECYTDWCNTQRTDGSERLYSPTNPNWLSWAIAGKWTKPKPPEPTEAEIEAAREAKNAQIRANVAAAKAKRAAELAQGAQAQ